MTTRVMLNPRNRINQVPPPPRESLRSRVIQKSLRSRVTHATPSTPPQYTTSGTPNRLFQAILLTSSYYTRSYTNSSNDFIEYILSTDTNNTIHTFYDIDIYIILSIYIIDIAEFILPKLL